MKFILAVIACSAASYLVGRRVSDRANAGRVMRAREIAEGWKAMYYERVERRGDARFKPVQPIAEWNGLSAESEFDFYSVDSIDATEH